MAKARRSSYKGNQNHRNRKLPIFFMFGGVVILLIAAFFAFQKKASPDVLAVNPDPGASLKVDKEKVDLGNMKLGNTARVSFTLTNVGNQPLTFSKAPYIEVKEGC